jgi:hypothetical protein
MYDFEPSPFLIEHSLIQKAVRRGNVELVEKVFKYLLNVSGHDWLRNRLAVIGYEECWPFADQLDFTCNDYKLLGQYKAIACKVKNKDCDGLAYLAKRLKQFNNDAETGSDLQRKAIRTIKNAILYPGDYWKWVRERDGYSANKDRIEAAYKAWKIQLMGKDQRDFNRRKKIV